MKKILFLIAIALCCRFATFAQATSLTVDCQTPGWLSSKINYGDQLTVENLTITGYLNSDDLHFIGSLMENHSLKGTLDLSEVTIIPSNKLGNNAFGFNETNPNVIKHSLKVLSLPITLEQATSFLAENQHIDTLFIGSEKMHIISSKIFGTFRGDDNLPVSYGAHHISNVVIREGVDSIETWAFYGNRRNNSIDTSALKCVFFPTTLKNIGEKSFTHCEKITEVHIPNGVEEIGNDAFYNTSFLPDTIMLPDSLRYYYLSSFTEKNNQVLYIGPNVTRIFESGQRHFAALHIASSTPPTINYSYWNAYNGHIPVYVPKGSKSFYTSNSNWSWANIIEEEVLAQSLTLDSDSINLIVGQNHQLLATVTPSDADNNLTWLSSNQNIAVVTSNGIVTAKGVGTAIITARTTDGTYLTAQCVVTVTQPVESVILEKHAMTLNVGTSEQLHANVLPTTANNKKLIWSSNNPQIATVDEDGNVTGVKAGTTFIKAVSEDNPDAMDSCKVTVLQPVTGITLEPKTLELYGIGSTATLIATVLPEDASNKEVRWASSNESVCIVSNGTVVALSYGISVIIATTVDGNFIATCTVTVKEGSPNITGDINGDGKVDIADVNAVINMMLGKTSQTTAGDVNSDGKVDIADVNAVINLMLGKSN